MNLITIRLLDILSIKLSAKDRDLVIYGMDRTAANCKRKLELAGLDNIIFLQTGEEEQSSDYAEETVGWSDIIQNKKAYYVLLTEHKGGGNVQANALLNAGLEYVEDFNFIEGARLRTKLDQRTALDPNMGHGTWSGNKYGCRFFGDYKKAEIRIAVNGASLADETVFDWKLWTAFLYEKLVQKGYHVAFALYSNYGYTTSQCFYKFIRDIVPQKPNLLIDYCPWENDCFYGKSIKTPYVVGYQKKALALLRGKIKGQYERNPAEIIQMGLQVDQPTEQVIAHNLIYTKRICDEEGIKYLCVLPPSAVTKKRNCLEDEEKYWALWRENRYAGHICEAAYKEFADILSDSIVDARSWLDEYDNIFYDHCHMYEDGNEIIADKLLEVIHEQL